MTALTIRGQSGRKQYAYADKTWARRLARSALSGLLVFLFCWPLAAPASALKPIVVTPEKEHLEITTLGDAYEGRGDSLMIETAAGGDGVTGRISVKAATPGTNPNWIVFALTNPTDKPIERWLTADRYTMAGSGVIWPDLDARRIEAVTPSIGFVPQRIRSDRADIFALTVEPGQTITYVAELSSERFARIHLWKPLEYEMRFRDRQLFNGIMLGLSVLTALFLTVIFAANHKLIFPASALLAWCVLAYLCVDFGFFHKIFNMKPEDNAVYRAAAESAMAASLVMFLHAFLRLGLTHGLIRMLSLVWIMAQLALVAVAAIDPRLAATFARFSFVVIGGIGGLVTLYLAIRGQDRAMHLLPPWILFLVWIFLAGVVLTGRLSGDIFVSALIGGLVLILLLIGFVVTQFAFRSLEPLAGLAPTDSQLRAIAVDGARSAVWEWSSRRDEIKVGDVIEQALGLTTGELNVKVDEFLQYVHPADRERFRLSLWSVQERAGGKIRSDFRMRHADNSYRWFELEAASVDTGERRAVRCVGLMRDVTETKMAHERLLQDAVHCSLTGLPNRELLIDRLSTAVIRARSDEKIRPAVFFIDIDRFKSINASLGFVVGDSLLLNVARRLQRHLGLNDTLARISGDQFAILFIDQQNPRELAGLAERVRRSLRAPMQIASQEVVLTGSMGIAIFDGEETSGADLLKEAEIAMYRARRSGSDRIEIFRPEMRGETNDRDLMEAALRKAIEKDQIKVAYQPIVYLPTEELAGFEALARMEHPKLGLISPNAFIPIAEESDLIVQLGSRILSMAVADAVVWQKELPRPEDQLFVSVNVSSRQVLRPELVQEVRAIIGRALIAKGTLKLEITESLAMENPEHAVEILSQIRDAGAELALDDFGTGYSSLAYLQRLPCDTIKLDRSLIKAAGAGEDTAATVVRAMVALAHELGKKVIAEGIETAEDVVFLRSIGCEYGQGYFYGEPMADRDVIDLLRIIGKSERKLQTHGFFKTKQRKARKKQKRDDARAADKAAADESTANEASLDKSGKPKTSEPFGTSAARPRAQALPQSSARSRQPRPAQPPPPPALPTFNTAESPPLATRPPEPPRAAPAPLEPPPSGTVPPPPPAASKAAPSAARTPPPPPGAPQNGARSSAPEHSAAPR
ncbi:MAG: EAL domain-containing protein, partial [Hyphomicrobiaceae bacterium]